MAAFNISSIGSVESSSDLKKVKSYLYKLSEELDYMFNNLTPEDNFSEMARVVYVEQGEKITVLETSVDGISATVKDTQKNYKSSMELLANLFSLKVETPEESSSVVLSGNKIELTTGKFIVNSTNLTIDEKGNATFSGKVKAASIEGSTLEGGSLTVGVFAADDDGCTLGDWLVSGKNASILRSDNGLIQLFAGSGSILLKESNTSDDGTRISGDVIRTGEIYLSGSWHSGWSLTSELQWLDNRISALE